MARLSDFEIGDNEENRVAITELGLDYELLTKYTSFIAVHEVVRNPEDSAQPVDQPLPMPQGVSDFAVGGPSRAGAASAAGARSPVARPDPGRADVDQGLAAMLSAMKRTGLPWISWGTAVLAAYGLKLYYSRASAEDLAWILVPTARAVGWLRGETLTLIPGAGWAPPDGSYFIAPACAGVNFMILVLTVSVLGFAHRLRSPGQRLALVARSLCGA